MAGIQDKLKEAVKRLLAEGRIDVLIGFEEGTLPSRARPVMIRKAEDADRLIWNRFCSNNLSVYLPRFFEPKKARKGEAPPLLPKVGIVAKGCDARSIAGLIRERQVPRGNVVIVAVPCEGMEDGAKAGSLLAACLECAFPAPEGADLLIEGPGRKPAKGGCAAAKGLAAKSVADRWEYFREETSRCIRCHACRQACPNCYCKECFADQTNPRWVGASDDLSETMMFHIGRIFHQAGRCVGCDACVRACPMGIDLRPLTQKLAEDVRELFGYSPGFSPDEPPPLCAYRQDDGQDFMTEP